MKINHKLTVGYPNSDNILYFSELDGFWTSPQGGYKALGKSNYVDLEQDSDDLTSQHYTLQWGKDVNFLEFMQARPMLKSVMASAKLGWQSLFDEIQYRAKDSSISVYDAACGYGSIANELINEVTAINLAYCGADIHGSLDNILKMTPLFSKCGLLIRWDISKPLPIIEKFDYVICRNAIHHTPNPEKSFESICSSLKLGGKIAISVYKKKAIGREALDEAFRNVISKMSPEEAFEVSRQFTILGKALQQIQETIILEEDLPLLGIKKGESTVHNLIYYHFLKCFYNQDFGDMYSTLVNYDWYHPPFAYRYEIDEVKDWFLKNGIELKQTITSDVQHYLEGIKIKV
jgi:SAM-dependent methyltransferase